MFQTFPRAGRAVLATTFFAGTLLGSAATGIGAGMLGSSIFPDVSTGSYYDEAIGELSNDGIIKGYDNGRFGPDDFVTRGQVAVMFQRFRDDLDGVTRSSSRSSRSTSDDDDDDSSSSSSRSSSSSIVTNNPKGILRFTTNSFNVAENASNLTVAVVRTGGADGAVTVKYALAAGTATEDVDYEKASGTLNFADGDSSKLITIKLKDDSASESKETFTVTLSDVGGGASLGTPISATVNIVDNEATSGSNSSSSSKTSSSSVNPAGQLSFAATVYNAGENAGNATITVQRTGGTTGSVNVNYATSNGSATSGTDYSATSGTLSFGNGESSKTFTVAISDDSSIDGSKAFNVTLSTPTNNATLGITKTASVSIVDDESIEFGSGSLRFSKATFEATEGDGYAQIIVQRNNNPTNTVTVSYSTTSGTAVGGSDFTHVSGTLTFAPFEVSKLILVPIAKDDAGDGGETFFVDITSPSSNAILGSPTSTTVTIY